MASDEFLQFTNDELELIDYALEGDWFFREAWERYGEDWPAYVPDNINVAMAYFFNMVLLPKQLWAYYCPIPDIMIHGGRFSGKTEPLACSSAMWAGLHPGNDWLHVSPSLDQAIISYNAIMKWGSAGKFVEKFLRHYRTAPAPTIYYKRWNEFDPGSEAQFRSVGQDPMELLRSFEAGRVTADEAFRNYPSDGPYRVLAGMVRGPNKYMLNAQPELKAEYDRLAWEVATELDMLKRQGMQDDLDRFAEAHGMSKDIRFMLYGNVGAYTWEWTRYAWGERNPDKRYSITWTSYDNPYCTNRQRELLKQQYKDDIAGLNVEMMATRPIAAGDIFTSEHVAGMLDGELDAEAIKAVAQDLEGWTWQVHEDYGVVRYAKPAESGAVYVAGGDPGTGRVPHRNKWVNLVFRLYPRPFELVYVSTGNMSREGQGSIDPWISDCKRILFNYPLAEGHFAAEAGGTQKNVHQVVWPEDLRIIPLNMNVIKATLIMEAQLMLRRCMFVAPNVTLLEQEMLGYQIQDKKLAQDFVMAFLAAVYVIWPYVAEEFVVEAEIGEPDEEGWYVVAESRDVRSARREQRSR